MKRIVLIDGENLCYGIRTLLGTQKSKASRNVLKNFDFRGLVDDLLSDQKSVEILWFGARLRLYDQTPELLTKTKQAIADQAQLSNSLRSQKIQLVKSGYLRARESDPCVKCGDIEWHLAEKGVDVGLAVEMLQRASKNIEIVMISADTDLLPAVKAARKTGCKIMYVGYENRPIAALSQATDSIRIISQPLVKKYQGDKK